MQELKGGAGVFAVKTKSPVVPVMFLKKPKAFRRTYYIVGEPFELSEFYDKKLVKEDYDKIDAVIREKMIFTREKLKELRAEKGKKCRS